MNERLSELIEKAIRYADEHYPQTGRIEDGKYVGLMAECLIADGVIVLPCKVGDTVYRLDDLVWKSDCDECEHFEEGWYDCPSECGRTNTATKFHECIEIKEEVITLQDILTYMKWNDFGKKVFLSREEAKKALAERRNNENN